MGLLEVHCFIRDAAAYTAAVDMLSVCTLSRCELHHNDVFRS